MSDSINVTIIGHSSIGLNDLENALQESVDIDITRKLLHEGATDPFEELPSGIDVLILDLGDDWEAVLGSVASRVRRNRTPIILVGDDGNTQLMRAALKAGARDFQVRPINASELVLSVRQLSSEPLNASTEQGRSVVIMPAKGGAGATAITTAIGHALAQRQTASRILLADLDFQYGNLPLYLDRSSTSRLTQALAAGERIDETLLSSCLIHTEEGIDLLATHSEQVFSSWEVPSNTTANLLNLIGDRYDYILFDIPRQIDPVTFQALERAAIVVIVMQQTLSDLRFTRQIIMLLRDQGLPSEKIRIVLNRHDKRFALRAIDVSDAFDGVKVSTLPNDFKRMSFATDNAVPLTQKFRKSSISNSIVQLCDEFFPDNREYKRGLFGRRKRVVNDSRQLA